MNGFSILFLIFGSILFLTGLYMFTGHKLGIVTERPAFKNATKSDWKNIGKWTMIVSIVILIISLVVYLFNI